MSENHPPGRGFEKALLALALAGAVLPWSSHVQFFNSEGGIALWRFFELAYVNLPASAMSNELLVVFVVLNVWMIVEARRTGIPHVWLYVTISIAVAVAAAFPLFLLARERLLRRELLSRRSRPGMDASS